MNFIPRPLRVRFWLISRKPESARYCACQRAPNLIVYAAARSIVVVLLNERTQAQPRVVHCRKHRASSQVEQRCRCHHRLFYSALALTQRTIWVPGSSDSRTLLTVVYLLRPWETGWRRLSLESGVLPVGFSRLSTTTASFFRTSR